MKRWEVRLIPPGKLEYALNVLTEKYGHVVFTIYPEPLKPGHVRLITYVESEDNGEVAGEADVEGVRNKRDRYGLYRRDGRSGLNVRSGREGVLAAGLVEWNQVLMVCLFWKRARSRRCW